MHVSEVMTRDVRVVSPHQTIQDAAKMMSDVDAGVLPVGENDQLVGMITDRDIAVRGIAQGKGPDTPVREVMTADVNYCFEDEDTDHVARNMADQQVRRLPVVNRDKRLVGILSLGDLAVMQGSQPAGEALAGISQPGGAHSQMGGPRM
ncbi:CBS domain-containing protein [Microvirga makkahensis]|uniref:CBS domain-containing protein n=1 Tax=Microvirga makkahensis TaxID=1128670 RepID=A0A7X3MWY4_9HYPH|nr:CBS domain-containing protein [Microvirga makkahensis]MXQ14786.1 CBS domain-containing protein [Microvirga makkahensis]